jgi:hypothetical protein
MTTEQNKSPPRHTYFDLLEALEKIERLLRESPCAAAHSIASEAIVKARGQK